MIRAACSGATSFFSLGMRSPAWQHPIGALNRQMECLIINYSGVSDRFHCGSTDAIYTLTSHWAPREMRAEEAKRNTIPTL